MTPKTGLFALIALAAMTSAATADCRTIAYTFRVAQNESVSTTGVSTNGSACVSRMRSFSTTQLTSGSIVSRPGNGTLSEIGALQFRYAPKKGFKGLDRYSIRICGTSPAGSGCATIAYSITVE